VQAKRFPASSWNGDCGPFAGGYVAAERDFFDVAVGVEDEVIDGTALDEDMRVVRGQPVELVDGPVAGKHVVDLALHRERPSVDLHFLSRFPD
jgi:hypothetical protein